MVSIFQQVLSLVTSSPGNLAYHVVLAFSITGALQAALHLLKDQEFPQVRRMVLGLSLLLLSRLVLFGFAGLTVMGLADPHTLLPVIDRGMTALCIVIITWLWNFPESTLLADAASGLLVLLILTALLLTGIWWGSNNDNLYFNTSLADYGWEIFSLLILIFGGILISIRRPNGWGGWSRHPRARW